ncbi:MAG: glycoside hydrolase [Candidatus Tectomicrobia bacterium]|uniref:Glycoside hydrolase n=1 Tax=Tectimicrobiota bacterium TaxID=2528274 RepID=A0A932CM83_UNCTE|nr:glycoside hydrolase [Candidatus Tectomicrobia bacterium]
MDRKLSLAFLWHMHQPLYKDPLTGEYALPWVRLHAVKSYFDMASLLEDFPQIRANFNLVPSLLMQILDYQRDGIEARDAFLRHTRVPATELNEQEKVFLLRHFFKGYWETMIRPYPRYWALLERRGLDLKQVNLKTVSTRFFPQDYRDLQVLFNLAWFGFRARQKWPLIEELLAKGQGYSEADKELVLRCQQEVLQQVLLVYGQAASRGQAELSVSPFYHPILPLVYDTEIARRCMPQAPLPQRFSYPEDALAQIQRAVTLYEKIFGERPRGMWPSEGSVCPEVIPLQRAAGLSWIATDEGILWNSLAPEERKRELLYQPHWASYPPERIAIVFRERELSDRLSFTYGRLPAREAVADFCRRLEEIRHAFADPLVCVILDGENPWEYYPGNGQEYLRHLYERLSQEPTVETVRLGDHLSAHPPQNELRRLFSGSWINSNYEVWIGFSEDNQGWNYLGRTRQWLAEQLLTKKYSSEQIQRAWEGIYAAEGSDWFWWYGPHFFTEDYQEFDRLFRRHLMSVYLALGEEIPRFLQFPIHPEKRVETIVPPVGLMTPTLDGQVTDYYEWQDAGRYSIGASPPGGSGESPLLSAVYYGFDLSHLYLRLDPHPRGGLAETEGLVVQVRLRSQDRSCHLSFVPDPSIREIAVYQDEGSEGASPQVISEALAQGKVIELCVPFTCLDLAPNNLVEFCVIIEYGSLELERYPQQGYLSFIVPEETFEGIMWRV